MKLTCTLAVICMFLSPAGPVLALAQNSPAPNSPAPRARDLGIPFDGTPGPLNAITDVSGVEVGFKTLISGEGRLVVGKGRCEPESRRSFRVENRTPTAYLRATSPETATAI